MLWKVASFRAFCSFPTCQIWHHDDQSKYHTAPSASTTESCFKSPDSGGCCRPIFPVAIFDQIVYILVRFSAARTRKNHTKKTMGRLTARFSGNNTLPVT